jgi:hypothetical protein
VRLSIALTPAALLASLATKRAWIQEPNLSVLRALALAASASRFFGGAVVSSERRRRVEISAISSTAARNEASFAFDGLLKPLIFLTNWSEAARTSSSVTGGSKLKRILIFLHIRDHLKDRVLKQQSNPSRDALH